MYIYIHISFIFLHTWGCSSTLLYFLYSLTMALTTFEVCATPTKSRDTSSNGDAVSPSLTM